MPARYPALSLNENPAAAHRVARRVADAAVNNDLTRVHRIAYRILRIAA